MKSQNYFIVVLAHSFHGRLRRLHIPHQAVYVTLALAVLGLFSVIGMATSYARMAWKVANYNTLQQELQALRGRYSDLQKSADQTNEQLASLQMFATEVSLAFGVKRDLNSGPVDVSGEGPLLPSFNETVEEYNFLKTTTFTRSARKSWQPAARPSLWPVYGRLTSSFGKRTDPFSGDGAFHPGVDLSASQGTPVKSAANGTVVHAHWGNGYGRLVVVDHGGGLQTYYAHLSRIDVVPGQEVVRGQVVGGSGASGRSTAPHLHYEVRQNGTPINPYIFLARSATGEKPIKDLPF
ncbi:MAG: peptidoglycan DD-metalloendopeptidase family protein [Bryobacteraceae bacterium]